MPTCRRKRVLLTEPDQELLELAQTEANKDVYLLEQTGEIFDTYEYVPPFSTHINIKSQPISYTSSIGHTQLA